MDKGTYIYFDRLCLHSILGNELAYYNDLRSRDDGLDTCIERLVLALFVIEESVL